MDRELLKKDLQENGFFGTSFRLPDNWYNFINLDNYKNTPINYLEIGAHYGANLLSVAKTYGLHPDSKLFCIDPWEDYAEYSEYNKEQTPIFDHFVRNIYYSGHKDKIFIFKGYSDKEILKFNQDFFDIIYIDGNHNPEYVLEDAVLSFRRLKVGGIIIFDDYGWGGDDCTKKGIDAFTSAFSSRIKVLGLNDSQVFIQRLS